MAPPIAKTKLVELFGLPKTGKTTTAKALVDYLRARGRSTHLVVERAGLCPIQDKLHPLFNLWTVTSLLKEEIEAINRGVDVVIADRGLLDALVWADVLCAKEKFRVEKRSIELLASLPILRNQLEVAYFFSANLETVLARRRERQIEELEGRVVNRRVLNQYLKSYRNVRANFAETIVDIDTSHCTVREMVQQVSTDLDRRLGEPRDEAGQEEGRSSQPTRLRR